MSQQDDSMELETVIAGAMMRCAYGRRYATAPEVYNLAGGIQGLRWDAENQPSYTPSENRVIRNTRAWAAKSLLALAISSTKKLRQVADALDALEAEEREDPRQSNIINAYYACDNYPPTLREVREKFVARLDERNRPPDFSIRKTLKWLGLPLAKAKRGRPRGSRSQIGNPRRVEQ